MKIQLKVNGTDQVLEIDQAKLVVLYVDRETLELSKLPSGDWRLIVSGKMLDHFKEVCDAEQDSSASTV